MTPLRALLLAALLCTPAARALEIGSLEFLGEAKVQAGTEFEGTVVGGLSGLSYDPLLDRYYVITDDPSLRSPSRFYTLAIDLGEGQLTDAGVSLEAVTTLSDRRGRPFEARVIDGEGIALTPTRTLLISSEGNVRNRVPPSIREVALDGREIREFRLPKSWKPKWDKPFGVRHNQAIESLTVVPGRSAFFAATENALHQDGPESDVGQGTRVRIVRYDLESGKPGAHYLYEAEPVVAAPPSADGFRTNGLVELLALDESRLIALERSYTTGVGNSIRLFLISTEGADDVRKVASLAGRTDLRPVSKRLLLDLSELDLPLDNVEGLTLGPELADGRKSLVLISDDNFNARQFTQVLAFAIGAERPTPASVQGAGHRSPLERQWVFGLRGVVTASDLDGRRSGFWIQDPVGDGDPSTSEAVFVAAGELRDELDPPLEPGDLVAVTGRVVETARRGGLPVTRIEALEIEIEGRGRVLPAPVRIGDGGRVTPPLVDDDQLSEFQIETDAIDFWESLEGMRVEVVEPRAVGPTTRFGTFTVVAGGDLPPDATERGGLLLRDSDSNPERLVIDTSLLEQGQGAHQVRVGDTLDTSVSGVLDYAFSNYRLVATTGIRSSSSDPGRGRSSLERGEDRLAIASYNVENLDAGDSAEKFERVARSIVDGLGSPDLLALQEIQDDTGTLDDGTVSATRTLDRLTEAIRAAGGPEYAFAQIDPGNNADGGAPGGNIRVAYLFNPERLGLARDPGPLLPANPARLSVDSRAFLADEETGFEATRKPLAAEFGFGEHRVLVINVHLKSKRGDDALFGAVQPPRRGTERQRLEQTSELGRKLQAVLDSEPEALIVLLGDFNEHEFREPMTALERFALKNLTPDVPADRRYSYNYEGNSQMLDHIVVSPALARLDPEVEIVHLNADYPHSDRASDHDPVLAVFDFGAPGAEVRR